MLLLRSTMFVALLYVWWAGPWLVLEQPLRFAAAVTAMVLVGAAACALPAFRATRVDPLLSIRQD